MDEENKVDEAPETAQDASTGEVATPDQGESEKPQEEVASAPEGGDQV